LDLSLSQEDFVLAEDAVEELHGAVLKIGQVMSLDFQTCVTPNHIICFTLYKPQDAGTLVPHALTPGLYSNPGSLFRSLKF
jgi:hypothetical protein